MKKYFFIHILICFLLGACIPNANGRDAPDAQQIEEIQQKIKRVHAGVQVWVQEGRNPTRIGRMLDQVDPLLKRGKIQEAEDLIDRALTMIYDQVHLDEQEMTSSIRPIPPDAELVFHRNGYIYTMRADGSKVTQITFKDSRHYEHVAVSYDRRYIIANEQKPNPDGILGGNVRLWLYDLKEKTETRLLPHFLTAGNGGVAWDPDGFIYFAGKEKDPYSRPKKRKEFIANAGANEVYKVRYDGTGLKRLTRTPRRGESDVGVSEDGKMVSYNNIFIDRRDERMEIWAMNADGTDRQLVYEMSTKGRHSAHDPEIYADHTRVVFSVYNDKVKHNWSCPGATCKPDADTAHDLYSINMDGTDMVRLTPPGPISIIPNVKGEKIVYMEMNERAEYMGAAIFDLNQSSSPKRIGFGAQMPKWIPD